MPFGSINILKSAEYYQYFIACSSVFVICFPNLVSVTVLSA